MASVMLMNSVSTMMMVLLAIALMNSAPVVTVTVFAFGAANAVSPDTRKAIAAPYTISVAIISFFMWWYYFLKIFNFKNEYFS